MVSSIMGLKDSPQERDLKTKARVFLTTLGARRVIVIAPAIADALSSLPISRDRLIEMPVVGIEDFPSPTEIHEDRRRFRSALRLSDEVPVVISVGNLAPRKSHELLVRAAAHVVRRHPAARFFIVGEGSMRHKLEREIRSHGLESSVALLGDRSDAARLLRAADVYVRPGVLEGFVGITVLEAQAARLPVVSFETEDVKLAVVDGQTGALVECGDVEGLATKIMSYIDDPDLAQRIGDAGGEAVRRRFSIRSITDALENFYAEIAGGGER
jgi:glycosyltransferase involved in cell wall biosynthesis